MGEATIMKLQAALLKSWSKNSSSKWTKDNPAKGQCGVTALVVNDLHGGQISKTLLDEGWHFYNEINEVRYDFTVSQFIEDIRYMNIPSNREEAFLDTNQKQYDSLMQRVKMHL
jgi:hypothetical protein